MDICQLVVYITPLICNNDAALRPISYEHGDEQDGIFDFTIDSKVFMLGEYQTEYQTDRNRNLRGCGSAYEAQPKGTAKNVYYQL